MPDSTAGRRPAATGRADARSGAKTPSPGPLRGHMFRYLWKGREHMKRQIAYLMVMSSMVLAPLAFTTGCAVTSGRESAGEYAKDKEIAARVKTRLYSDPTTKGTEIEVQSLRGVVQLS